VKSLHPSSTPFAPSIPVLRDLVNDETSPIIGKGG
jgi:hypothetical protein